MSLSIAFWVTVLVWLILGIWSGTFRPVQPAIGNFILFFLICLIGYKVFGSPIHG